MNEFSVNVKLANGSVTTVRVVAQSWADARIQASAYGTVVGYNESRTVSQAW